MKKVKDWVLGHKPLTGLLVALIFFGVAFGVWYSNRPIDILKEATVTFDGYDSRGKASYNSTELTRKYQELVYQKAGFSKDQIAAVLDGQVNFNALTSIFDQSTYTKIGKAQEMLSGIRVDLTPTDNLSNGDKVTLSVTVTNKDLPVVSGSREFTVSGLKESQKKTVQELMQEEITAGNLAVTGYNSDGSLTYNNNRYSLSDGKTSNLKNGDVLTFKVYNSYVDLLEKQGIIVTGDLTYTYTVSGLKDVGKVNRLTEIYPKFVDYMNRTYTNTNQTTFKVEQVGGYYLRVDETTSYVNNAKRLNFTPALFFKVTQKDQSAPTEKVRFVRVTSYFELPDGGINDDTIKTATMFPLASTISNTDIKTDQDLLTYIDKESEFIPYKEN